MQEKLIVASLMFAAGIAGAHFPRSAPSVAHSSSALEHAPQAQCKTSGNCRCGDNCACSAQGECLNATKPGAENMGNSHVLDASTYATKELSAPAKPSTAHWPDKIERVEHMPDGSKVTTTSTRTQTDASPPASPAPAVSPAAASGVSYMPAPQPGYRWDCSTGVCRQVPIVQQQPVYRQQQGYYRREPVYGAFGRIRGYRNVWVGPQRTYYRNCPPGRG